MDSPLYNTNNEAPAYNGERLAHETYYEDCLRTPNPEKTKCHRLHYGRIVGLSRAQAALYDKLMKLVDMHDEIGYAYYNSLRPNIRTLECLIIKHKLFTLKGTTLKVVRALPKEKPICKLRKASH